jgi:Ca-activated chloride channel family protein
MIFLAANRLWLLAAVALLAMVYVALQRRRRHYAVRFANLPLLESVAPRRPGWRRHVAAGAVAFALIAFIVGLARPVHAEEVPKKHAVVLLVLDTSASMEATDVSPSRIAAAVAAAKHFVDDSPDGFQIGLVTFNKSAQLVASPTTDHDAVIAALDTVTTAPSTATGEGIYTALDAIKATLKADHASTSTADNTKVASIILLSDGNVDTGRSATSAAQAAKDQHVAISAIAYGTAHGTITLEGKTVSAASDPTTMEQVAKLSGGTEYSATSARELDSVYHEIQSRVGYHVETREIVVWFVGIGVLALLAAVVASMLWTARFL